MNFKNFVGKPCTSRTAFEFMPESKTILDLEGTARALEENGAVLEAETPFLIIVKMNDCSLNVFKSGKLLIKGTKDKECAESTARKAIKHFKECLEARERK